MFFKPTNIFNRYVEFPTPRSNKRKDNLIRWMIGMLRLGSPLPNILESLADVTSEYHGWLLKMSQHAREGITLSGALKKDNVYLPGIYKAFIKTGEAYNILPQALTIAGELRSSQWPPSQKGKFIYFLLYFLFIGFMLTFIFSIFVIPVFTDMFASFGSSLPYLTQISSEISRILLKYGWIFMIFIIIAYLGLSIWNRYIWSYILRLFMFIPVVGKLAKLSWQWKIFYGLGSLMREGVPLDKALGTLGRGLNIPFLRKAEERVALLSEQGVDPFDILKRENIFSKDIKWALSFSDPGKDLYLNLIKIGERYREILGIQLTRFVSFYHIFFLIILFVIIGFMVISMYLPLFEMAKMAA
jgi:type IV pilus assembly protein PilC